MSKFSTLIKLAKKGDTDRLLEHLEDGKTNINEIDPKSGQGLLHIAIQNDDEELFKLLANRPGADLQLCNKEGETPLDIAVRLNNPGIVAKLIDMNVNYRKKNNNGENVLHMALREQTHRDILKKLTSNNRFDINQPIDTYGSYLNLAIVAGHAQNFYFLIKELGIEYTKNYDIDGNTCLILAVKHNKGDFVVAILEKLEQDPLLTQIDKQFFINHQNNEGNTAIHVAAVKNLQTISQKIEKMGEKLGLDHSIRNKKGLTYQQIKQYQEKDRKSELEMEKKRQEEKVIRKRQKNEEKTRQRQEQERRQQEQLRLKKQAQKREEIEVKVTAQIQKKKTLWIAGIIFVIILGGMYIFLTSAIEKKKPVTL